MDKRADGSRASSTLEDVSMFFAEDPIFDNGVFDASGDEKSSLESTSQEIVCDRIVPLRLTYFLTCRHSPPQATIGQRFYQARHYLLRHHH